jgi:hypothetical protein
MGVCRQAEAEPFKSPLTWAITGRNVFSMLVQGCLFFALTLLIEWYQPLTVQLHTPLFACLSIFIVFTHIQTYT